MFQAMFKMGIAGLLSFTSLFLWPLSGSPPAMIQAEVKGEGIIELVQNDQKYECTAQSQEISLALDEPFDLQVRARPEAEIASLVLDGQEIEEAASLQLYEKKLQAKEKMTIQAVFEKEPADHSIAKPGQSAFDSNDDLPAKDSGWEADSSASSAGLALPKRSDADDQDKKQVHPFFSSLGQAISTWTAGKIRDQQESSALQSGLSESSGDELDASSWQSSLAASQDLAGTQGSEDSSASQKLEDSKSGQPEEAPAEESEDRRAKAGRLYEHILDEQALMALFNSFETSFYQVYDDYQSGQAAQWKDLRLAAAAKAGLEDALDEEGFLPAEWFESADDQSSQPSGLLEQESMDDPESLQKQNPEAPEEPILEEKESGQPIPGYAQLLNPGLVKAPVLKKMMRKAAAPASASALRVTKKELKNYISMFGGALTNSIWTLSNGCQAFCADGIKAAPQAGAIVKSIAASQNSALRKALYYGYQGPANLLANPANLNGAAYSQAQQIVITNDLVSEANSGTCLSKRYGLWSPGMENIYRLVLSQPEPPKEFKVYLCTFEGTGLNGLGDTMPFQPLAYGVMSTPEKAGKGALQVLKTDANPTISNAGGSNYSLAGAEFRLVKGASGESGTFVQTLTIGKDEASQVVEVDPGIYWVKETKAPKGYALNPEWHRIEVTADSSMEGPCRILVKNAPQYTPVDLLLRKINSFTGQPDARLAGAKFKICYFAIDPSDPLRSSTATPSDSWILQTDANGEIRAPGSKFPIGVITIEEIEAPAGFKKDETIYRIGLDPKGSSQEVFQAYHPPTIRERPLGVNLLKKDETGSLSLAGAVFKITSPSNASHTLTTDAQGLAFIELDENGTWLIEEIQAPEGYSLNPIRITLRVSDSALECDAPAANGTIELSGQHLLVRDLPESYGIRITKKNRKDQPLANAVFGLYSDAALGQLVAKVTTDKEGEAVFGNLAPGSSWYLTELEAPDGYQLPLTAKGKPKVYMIRATARPNQDPLWSVNGKTISSQMLSEAYGYARLEMENEKTAMVGLTVYNEQLALLPETGSLEALLSIGAGTLMALGGMIAALRKKEKDSCSKD